MYGTGIGSLNVYANGTRVFTVSGQQSSAWTRISIPINGSNTEVSVLGNDVTKLYFLQAVLEIT